jgi:hypothetical protein
MTYVARTAPSILFEILSTDTRLRRVVKYESPSMVVMLTRQRKHDGRDRSRTYLLTVGAPNYKQRAFVAACKKSGEPFPVGRVQFEAWPQPRLKAKKAAKK